MPLEVLTAVRGSTRSSQIAGFLGAELLGPDIDVTQPCPVARASARTVVFARQLTPELALRLNGLAEVCVIVERESAAALTGTRIPVDNPRLAFARVVSEFFSPPPPVGIESTAVIGRECRLGQDVYVGHYTVIADGVEIGDRTVIEHHVCITGRVRIGSDCHIRSNSVIGGAGYGFERDPQGTPIRIPHVGGVRIGNDVEIGSLNAIARGTLDDTVIEDHAKLDDHVFIAHNVRVGRNAMVIAGAEVSGSVDIGDGAWIAPQATILNKVTIGAGATVGIGAVVIRDVAPGSVVVGNPARPLDKRPARTDAGREFPE